MIHSGPVSHQSIASIEVDTDGRGFVDLTARVAAFLRAAEAGCGLVTVFIRHTSASLTIQENASPEVLEDLDDALDRLAPRDGGWRHDVEGPDDMPAHVKTALTSTSIAVPVVDGRMALGTWQALYLIEHRDRSHLRELIVHYAGSKVGS